MIVRQVHVRYQIRQRPPLSPSWTRWPTFAEPEWQPPCDVYETDREWIVQVDVAGVDEREVEVVLYEDGLLVEGTRAWRRPGAEDEALRVYAAEIRYGPFRLARALPPGLARDAATATYERGVLLVRVPKQGSAS